MIVATIADGLYALAGLLVGGGLVLVGMWVADR